jgi:hypothetical protein
MSFSPCSGRLCSWVECPKLLLTALRLVLLTQDALIRSKDTPPQLGPLAGLTGSPCAMTPKIVHITFLSAKGPRGYANYYYQKVFSILVTDFYKTRLWFEGGKQP